MGNFLICIASMNCSIRSSVFAFGEDEHIVRRAILDEARYLQLAGRPLYLAFRDDPCALFIVHMLLSALNI
jgi:hypothetical protein